MKKYFLIGMLLLFMTLFLFGEDGINFEEKYNFVKEQMIKRGMSEYLSDKLSKTINEEIITLKLSEKNINPILMLSLIDVESDFRNILGDNGKSFGFYQIQEVTVWYVMNFFPDIKEKYIRIKELSKQNGKTFEQEMLKYPILQTQISIRYLYLLSKFKTNNDNLLQILSFYNGRNPYINDGNEINDYTVKIIEDYSYYLLTYNLTQN